MNADALLERLVAVRQTGDRRWLARCPAHEDQAPSLSIRELEDGRILLHCFAGCDTQDVLSHAGVNFGDLYPEPLPHSRGDRRALVPSGIDVLRTLDRELLVISVAAENVAAGVLLDDPDTDRLRQAVSRVRASIEVLHA